jgi:hypothetical protein
VNIFVSKLNQFENSDIALTERIIGEQRIEKDREGSRPVLIYQHLPGVTEESHENHVRIAGLQAETCTRDLTNTKQMC